MVRLNLGCGFDKHDGFVNVDSFRECRPDVMADLEHIPWPFADDCADEVLMKHVLEHLGQDPRRFLRIMQELYRVCRHKARVRVIVPHYRHDNFIADPTHVRAFTPLTFRLFSREANLDWVARGVGNSMLALQTGVDFALVESTAQYDEPWVTAMREGRLTRDQVRLAAQTQNNVIREATFVLEVLKVRP